MYENVYSLLSDTAKAMIQDILTSDFKNDSSKSLWYHVKQEPKKPTINNVREFVKHLNWLRSFNDCLHQNMFLLTSKLKRSITEARALNIAKMNELAEHKKYTLTALFLQSQTQKALDDIIDILIRIVQKLLQGAHDALKEHQLSQTRNTDNLVLAFRDVIQAFQTFGTKEERFNAISDSLKKIRRNL